MQEMNDQKAEDNVGFGFTPVVESNWPLLLRKNKSNAWTLAEKCQVA